MAGVESCGCEVEVIRDGDTTVVLDRTPPLLPRIRHLVRTTRPPSRTYNRQHTAWI